MEVKYIYVPRHQMEVAFPVYVGPPVDMISALPPKPPTEPCFKHVIVKADTWGRFPNVEIDGIVYVILREAEDETKRR